MIQLLYRLLLWLALLPIAGYLLYRSKKQPLYRQHWLERLGFYAKPKHLAPILWVHAVSVGETRASKPLITALKKHYPGYHFVITQMTPTGRETAQSLFPDNTTIVYLPYDYPSAVKRFLGHFQPEFGLILETEIWPNLIDACTQYQIPLFLVNARLSESSLQGYLRIRALIKPALQQLTAIAAQTEDDAKRLAQLGAQHLSICGNIKFDQILDSDKIGQGLHWKKNLQRPTLLFASSRDGEEALFLDCLQKRPLPEAILIIMVPRHPQRFDKIEELIKSHHLPYLRRSLWQESPLSSSIRVLLGDTMGEMESYYACANLVLMGGSFLPLGGQNLIEAAQLHIPSIVGPHMFNFTAATQAAVKIGASIEVQDIAAAIDTARALFANPAQCEIMQKAAQTFIKEYQGAVNRILPLLPPPNNI